MNLLLEINLIFGNSYMVKEWGGSNPTWAVSGFILMIIIVVLAIREKLRKQKESKVIENMNEEVENLYIEKDVLGLDKTYTNYNEPTYKIANKSKFKFIIFITIFLIGLFLAIVFTPKKYDGYKNERLRGPHGEYNIEEVEQSK